MSPTLFSRLRSALRAEPKNALALPVVPDRVPRYPVVYPGSAGKPFPLLADLIEAFSRDSPPDVLFFGDSVLERISNSDDDKRTLADMLRNSVARDVYFANRPAFNPTLGAALMDVIGRLRRPKLLVVEVNVRCFSPQWDQNPAWAFQQELAAIDAWLADPKQPLPAIEDVRASAGFFEAFDRTPVNFELSKLATAGQFRALAADRSHDSTKNRDRARELFIFHYTHRLIPGHRKLLDLVSIAERAAQFGIDLLLYLTPMNSLAGEDYVGAEFRNIHNDNIRVLREALGTNGRAIVDLSTAFPRSAFFHADLPTEHLNQAGRSLLVSSLLPLIDRPPRPSQS